MCCCGTCTGNRNMRQRGEIVKGKAAVVNVFAKFSVTNSCTYCDGTGGLTQGNDLVQIFSRQQIFVGIRNSIKAMSSPERTKVFGPVYYLAYFFGVGRLEYVGRAIGKISCPVFEVHDLFV